MTASAITVAVLLAVACFAVIFAAVWALYRFRTREERRGRRDLVRRLRAIFDDADARGALTSQQRVEIYDGLRRLHRG
ncbi:hypothetical protein [Curtobacterium sp. VKM Ac-2887]|uniref:hypothetical protein n=1 Tax=Curtobacterium sp. VKM Ac-2887 TaxID=2783819 RepID=UPI00188D1DC2|nr:hypothetical protein [Curtobacterium sp. VKM Ac-2887]MBF4588384.1 hypothetical protein [Curtobacterium sp. VKM Ac-2887]